MASRWGMRREQRLEQFSRTYVRAVAAVAGFAVYEPEVDEDSIDMGLAARGPMGTVRSPRIEMQIKGTPKYLHDDGIHFPLKIKNYEDLRHEDVQVPRILVVVIVPKQMDSWIQQSESELAMRRCGYWMSLRGREPTANKSRVTVVLPREHILSPQAMVSLMRSASRRGSP